MAREHRELVAGAASLSGLASALKTPEDADQAVVQLAAFGRRLTDHLIAEDRDVYSVLMSDPDPGIRSLAADAFGDVGGLVSAWRMLSAHWTRTAILADPARFADAMSSTLDALMLRIELEENLLYPAAQAAAHGRRAEMADA
ncbi:hypothetical protein GCM10009101_31600 [Brevundimonas lenta]